MRRASDIKYGERVKISDIDTSHPSSRRIIEIGFTPGQEIELITKGLFNDPIAISLRGTVIAIRRNEADCIKISE